jgi:RecA/RadA recombinase
MSRNAVELRLDDLEIRPNLITKLKNAGIESIFDLAVSIPHDLNDNMLSGTDEGVALDIVMKAKNALINAGLLVKDFSTAEDFLERRRNLLKCTTGSTALDSFLKGGDIRLLVVNNLTKFFRESKNKNASATTLKDVLGTLCKTCAKNKIALVCTGSANVTSKGVIARPIGGTFLKHALNIIVHLREYQYSSFKATLIKHQYVKTPKSVILYGKKAGKILLT